MMRQNNFTFFKITTLLIAFAISIIIVNNTLFLHAHRYPNGTIFYHAHPYNKSTDSFPIKAHKHSNAEILFFQQISTFIGFAVATLYITAIVAVFVKLLYKYIAIKSNLATIVFKNKAPPVL